MKRSTLKWMGSLFLLAFAAGGLVRWISPADAHEPSECICECPSEPKMTEEQKAKAKAALEAIEAAERPAE